MAVAVRRSGVRRAEVARPVVVRRVTGMGVPADGGFAPGRTPLTVGTTKTVRTTKTVGTVQAVGTAKPVGTVLAVGTTKAGRLALDVRLGVRSGGAIRLRAGLVTLSGQGAVVALPVPAAGHHGTAVPITPARAAPAVPRESAVARALAVLFGSGLLTASSPPSGGVRLDATGSSVTPSRCRGLSGGVSRHGVSRRIRRRPAVPGAVRRPPVAGTRAPRWATREGRRDAAHVPLPRRWHV
ncbi:hypothetical protein ND748_25105 [Frankia sp. AiPs1]|nr:hypothetical protein [Frankia sp. AiPs1]